MRAVWNPARMSLTVERSSTDATGTKRWDHLFIMNNNGFDPAASTKFMSQIYTLITEGVRP